MNPLKVQLLHYHITQDETSEDRGKQSIYFLAVLIGWN